jgi:hypothetical protein
MPDNQIPDIRQIEVEILVVEGHKYSFMKIYKGLKTAGFKAQDQKGHDLAEPDFGTSATIQSVVLQKDVVQVRMAALPRHALPYLIPPSEAGHDKKCYIRNLTAAFLGVAHHDDHDGIALGFYALKNGAQVVLVSDNPKYILGKICRYARADGIKFSGDIFSSISKDTHRVKTIDAIDRVAEQTEQPYRSISGSPRVASVTTLEA